MRLRSAADVRWLLVGVAVVALVVRLVPLLLAGVLQSALGYDDGVHLAMAQHLISGQLPYRDVLFVHPPGIVLTLAPVAALAHVVGDPWALAIGRLVAMAVGVVNAVLVGWVLRRRGTVAVLTGGLLYAFWGPAIAAERSIYLEPFIGLGLLIALSALARRPSGGAGRHALAISGIALGAALAFKAWVVLDLAVVGFLVLARHGLRGTGRWLGWCALGFLPLVTPFALAAPREMWQDVVVAQASRPQSRGPVLERIAALDVWHGAGGPVPRVVVAIALLVGLLWLVVRVVRVSGPPSTWPDPVWWALVGVVHVVSLAAAPSYYLHYSAFVAPPACLLAGAGAGAIAQRIAARGGVRPAARVALGALLVAGVLAPLAGFPPVPKGARADVGLIAALTRTGCTWSANPSYLLAAGLQGRMIADGCPGQPDLFGTRMVESAGLPVPGTPGPLGDQVTSQLAASRTALVASSAPDQWLGARGSRYLHKHFALVVTTGNIEVWQRTDGS